MKLSIRNLICSATPVFFVNQPNGLIEPVEKGVGHFGRGKRSTL